MIPRYLFIAAAMLVTAAGVFAEDIDSDTTWSGSVVLTEPCNVINASTLTIAPGATVTFQNDANISIYQGSALNAQGAAFIGASNGGIIGWDGDLRIDNCTFEDMGMSEDSRHVINLGTTPGGQITIQNSRFDNCGGLYLQPTTDGDVLIQNNTFRNQQGNIQLYGNGAESIVTGNTLNHGGIIFTGECGGIVSHNILIDGTIQHYTSTSVTLEYNYIANENDGVTVVRELQGTIRKNVIRGGSWTTGYIGGLIEGNVFISLPVVGDNVNETTHEHLCGLSDDSVVQRNIFIGGSYGAIMAIGSGTAARALICNNTFDLHNYGWAYYVHLPDGPVVDGTFINNLLIRTGGARVEGDFPACLTTWDYNLWADLSGARFENFTISGKSQGDEGFALNDLPSSGSYPHQEVVVDADVVFPFTNRELLDQTRTVEELLAVYRNAYAPIAASEAINNGSAQYADDPLVIDGQPDIGAVEYEAESSQETADESSATTQPAESSPSGGCFISLFFAKI